MDPMLQLMLSTTISTAVDLLAQLGFGDTVKELHDRLTRKTEKARQVAFDKAYQAALAKLDAMDEKLLSLLKHKPFQEEVVRGLLDLNNPFDWKAASLGWGELLPEQAAGLRKFYYILEMALTEDETWGPILERYRSLRNQTEAQEALQQRGWPDTDLKLIQKVSNTLYGDLVQAGGIKIVQQGGQLISGTIEQFVQIIIQQLTITQPVPPDPSDLHALYLQHIASHSNLLPWTYFKVENADPEQGERLQLADVYIDLDTTEMRHVEREEELRQLLVKQREAERIPAQEVVNRDKRLLVLGDPGFGKSTFIKHLAYQLAQAGLAVDPSQALGRLSPWEHGLLHPVWVELRRLAAFMGEQTQNGDAALLVQFIRKDLQEWGMEAYWPRLHSLLGGKQEKLILLLDGLDEVPAAQRQAVVDTVSQFSLLYANQRYVVTCRPYAYVGQPWRLHNFHEVTLAPFNEGQIDRFVDNWYLHLANLGRLEPRQASEKAESLKQAVRRRDLFELAERPLLLTVMTQLHAYSGLPEDRTQLYADAVQLLLQRWEGRLGKDKEIGVLAALDIPGLKMNDLKEGLYQVAFCAHQQCATAESTADISEGDLRGWLAPFLGNDWKKAGDFMDYIRERAGLLIRHKPNAYTFPHRTFQEFLAACRLASQIDFPATAAGLVQQDWDRWREVFILAVGYAARTDRLWAAIATLDNLLPQPIEEIVAPEPNDWRSAMLAGEGLLEVGLVSAQRDKPGQRLYARTRDWLVAALGYKTLPARQRATAGSILARLGDPRFDTQHWNLPKGDLCGFMHIPAGPFHMGTDKQDIPRLIKELGGDKDFYQRETPRHTVSLAGFYLGCFPVTQAQFNAFVQAGGYDREEYWIEAKNDKAWQLENRQGMVKDWRGEARTRPDNYGEPFSLSNHPVVGVTWYEALAYSRWLNQQLRSLAPAMLKALENETQDRVQIEFWRGLAEGRMQVKLPSEAEWEKAARGRDGRQYPWEGDFDHEKANTFETNLLTTSAVGCFPDGASQEGVLDLSGNVWEWTRSLYTDYPYPGNDNPDKVKKRENLTAKGPRVLRGGAFFDDRRGARGASRGGFNPGYQGWGGGFRLVVSLL